MIRNDPVSICLLADSYHHGSGGLQQDRAKTMELYAKAAELGDSERRPCSTTRPQLWLDTKWHGATLEQWRQILETWNELLNIGQLQHLLGVFVPCII